jgi:hypothetical protein
VLQGQCVEVSLVLSSLSLHLELTSASLSFSPPRYSSPFYDAWGASFISSHPSPRLIHPRYLDSSLASLSWEPLDADEWTEMEQRRGRSYSGLQLSLLDLKNVETGLRGGTRMPVKVEKEAAELAPTGEEGRIV